MLKTNHLTPHNINTIFYSIRQWKCFHLFFDSFFCYSYFAIVIMFGQANERTHTHTHTQTIWTVRALSLFNVIQKQIHISNDRNGWEIKHTYASNKRFLLIFVFRRLMCFVIVTIIISAYWFLSMPHHLKCEFVFAQKFIRTRFFFFHFRQFSLSLCLFT